MCLVEGYNTGTGGPLPCRYTDIQVQWRQLYGNHPIATALRFVTCTRVGVYGTLSLSVDEPSSAMVWVPNFPTSR